MKTIKALTAFALMAGLAVLTTSPAAAEESNLTAELQSMVAELTTEQQAALYLLLSQLSGSEAAAPAEAAAENPEEVITEGILAFFEAAKNGDDETMLSFFSEDFQHFMFGNRDGLLTYLDDARSMGYLEGIEVDMSYAEFKEEEGKITVYPVDVQGSFGLVTFEYVLHQEDGEWRVIELDAEGL